LFSKKKKDDVQVIEVKPVKPEQPSGDIDEVEEHDVQAVVNEKQNEGTQQKKKRRTKNIKLGEVQQQNKKSITIDEKLDGTQKYVVYYMGDIHGQLDKVLQALVHAQFLKKVKEDKEKKTKEFEWQSDVREDGAIVYFAQTGDVFDKGKFGEEAIKLLHEDGKYTMKVGEEEITINGKIPKDYLLRTLGNHDAYPLLGKGMGNSQFTKNVGGQGFKKILICNGELRQSLKGTPIVRKFGDTVFLHGGISLVWANKAKDVYNKKEENDKVTTECTADGGVTVAECTISGNELIRNLNEAAMSVLWSKDDRYCAKDLEDYQVFFNNPTRTYFDKDKPKFLGDKADQNVQTMTSKPDCPLWYRNWIKPISEPGKYTFDEKEKQEYEETLAILGAKRMVMGHEIIQGIAVENEGTRIGIDVGLYKKNSLSLLKIEYVGPNATKMSTISWIKGKKKPVTTEVWPKIV